jgi:hypothetical protein
MIVLTANRSAEPALDGTDDAELTPIRPEAWAAWAKAAPPESPTEQPSDVPGPVPGPVPVRRTVHRSGGAWGALVRQGLSARRSRRREHNASAAS